MSSSREATGDGRFLTTRWSLVSAAAAQGSAASKSLEELCRAYWYPLYAFSRRRGASAADAEDLVQAFFTRLLERRDLAAVDRERGRFRSWLLASLSNFTHNEREKGEAQKRGGGRPTLSVDGGIAEARYANEPSTSRTPESEFERAWALEVLDRARSRLREEYASRDKSELFAALEAELAPGAGESDRKAMATQLGLRAGALKVAIHRLRQRFGDALRAEVGETVATEAEIDLELSELLAALAG